MNTVLKIGGAVAAALALASCGCTKSVAKPEAAVAQRFEVPEFSADSAYANIAGQIAFGPRIGGSDAHAECAIWLERELLRHGADTVIIQCAELDDFGEMVNLHARFNPQASRRIMLLAHWDSRPWADADADPANHSKPLDGANDGASGVGVLLELARLMGDSIPAVGVDLLFVDAEDAGCEGDDSSWARGAQYWVENMPQGVMPEYAVLLDMVGGRNAIFPKEMISDANCRALTTKVWSLARAIGLESRFPNRVGGAVNDDHVPLLKAGIPAIDIIETAHPQTGSFNPTWHTLQDNLENIDRKTLGDVGRLITTLIYSEQP